MYGTLRITMAAVLPKPDLHRVVNEIQELTSLGSEQLSPAVGGMTFEAETVLRQIITRAYEAGINAQRQAFKPDGIDQDEVITQKIPAMPKKGKLPGGV
jgi:hypothetical protein